MISLIKNELAKIFHKKIIYIFLIIALAFIVLTNVLISNYSYDGNSYYNNKDYINILIEENKKMDLTNKDNIDWYINNQNEIDAYQLQEKYGFDSWQASLIYERLYGTIHDINFNTYSKLGDKEALDKAKKEYAKIIARLDSNDWKSFVNDDVKTYEKEKINLDKELKEAKGETEISNLKSQIYSVSVQLEVLNLRLTKNISYNDGYLNDALKNYERSKTELYNYENKKITDEEKSYYNELKSGMEKSKYIIDTGKNVDENKSLRSVLVTFYNEYSFLIVVIIIVISGIIVSEEYNKGTIKLLLIRPYSRAKILLSKYLTCLIILAFTILSFLVLQLIIGTIFFGTSSLSIPVINYNFNTESISILNVFSYLGLTTITILPKLLLLMTLAFALGTIFGHSAIAIAVTLIGYVGSDILNYLVIANKVEFMKYWVTLNWDFDGYLFGQLPAFKYVNLNLSIITCIVYFLVMIIVSFIVFKKKNIKNI